VSLVCRGGIAPDWPAQQVLVFHPKRIAKQGLQSATQSPTQNRPRRAATGAQACDEHIGIDGDRPEVNTTAVGPKRP
jgi:hypothetical protein